MRFSSQVSAVLLVACALGTRLAAQTPRGLVEVPERERAGFWIGAGLGAGAESYDLRDGLGYGNTLTEPTVSLLLGGTLGQHWRLGGEALVWFHDIDGGTSRIPRPMGAPR